MKKEKQGYVIEIAKIIKNSKLDNAQFSNVGLAPIEYDVEVVKVAEKIVKLFKKAKKYKINI